MLCHYALLAKCHQFLLVGLHRLISRMYYNVFNGRLSTEHQDDLHTLVSDA